MMSSRICRILSEREFTLSFNFFGISSEVCKKIQAFLCPTCSTPYWTGRFSCAIIHLNFIYYLFPSFLTVSMTWPFLKHCSPFIFPQLLLNTKYKKSVMMFESVVLRSPLVEFLVVSMSSTSVFMGPICALYITSGVVCTVSPHALHVLVYTL